MTNPVQITETPWGIDGDYFIKHFRLITVGSIKEAEHYIAEWKKAGLEPQEQVFDRTHNVQATAYIPEDKCSGGQQRIISSYRAWEEAEKKTNRVAPSDNEARSLARYRELEACQAPLFFTLKQATIFAKAINNYAKSSHTGRTELLSPASLLAYPAQYIVDTRGIPSEITDKAWVAAAGEGPRSLFKASEYLPWRELRNAASRIIKPAGTWWERPGQIKGGVVNMLSLKVGIETDVTAIIDAFATLGIHANNHRSSTMGGAIVIDVVGDDVVAFLKDAKMVKSQEWKQGKPSPVQQILASPPSSPPNQGTEVKPQEERGLFARLARLMGGDAPTESKSSVNHR